MIDGDDLTTLVGKQFVDAGCDRIGIAVSGGGDSVALLHLMARALAPGGVTLEVATVDHGLRPEAGTEVDFAAGICATLGLRHDRLEWIGWDGTGNLQDQARRARYRLLTQWARDRGIAIVALGHTADDQAETLLMRLGRAAGVEGLSGMPVRRERDGITFLRPLLGVTRATLRRYLDDSGLDWIEDPSNRDERFDRVRARAALDALGPLGITVQTLVDVAAHMAAAGAALDFYAARAATALTRIDAGDVVIERRGYLALPDETARQLLVRAVCWIAHAEYPPRRQSVHQAIAAIGAGVPATLGGCMVEPDGAHIRVCREPNAVRDLLAAPDEIWDNRWSLEGPPLAGAQVRALGESGLRMCPDWKETGLVRAALLASPAVWSGDTLVAAPLAGYDNGWTATPTGGKDDFVRFVLSH